MAGDWMKHYTSLHRWVRVICVLFILYSTVNVWQYTVIAGVAAMLYSAFVVWICGWYDRQLEGTSQC